MELVLKIYIFAMCLKFVLLKQWSRNRYNQGKKYQRTSVFLLKINFKMNFSLSLFSYFILTANEHFN